MYEALSRTARINSEIQIEIIITKKIKANTINAPPFFEIKERTRLHQPGGKTGIKTHRTKRYSSIPSLLHEGFLKI